MKVAIFGGSFNPPHLGHQLAALYVLESADVDALWFVPCFDHPFDKALAPFEQRLAMCRLAAEALGPRVKVSAIEKDLGGKSRTFDTVSALRKAEPGTSFSLVIGTDLLAEIDMWHRAEELKAMVSFVVVGRQGSQGGGAKDALAIPNVSSTLVRQRLAKGQGVETLVPRAVRTFIETHGLYRGPA